MNLELHLRKALVDGALSLALAACAATALAQPAPNAAPARIAPGPAVGRVTGIADVMTPLMPVNAPDPSSDPRDLDGVWHRAAKQMPVTDMYGYPTPLNEAGKKVVARRAKALKEGTPYINASAKCFPVGLPLQMDLNMPFHIFQSKDRFDILFEEYHGLVTISMDPANAPEPGYMGRSIGHWDGDTLVVETTGFKEPLWLGANGMPASKNAKLTSRIRKVKSDWWFLEVVNTLDDPTYYTRPWSWVRDYIWRPDMQLFREYNCELQTGAKNGVDPSLIPEPEEN